MNERLRKIRERLTLSRSAFGERLGVSGDVINNLERGRVEIKEPMVKLICSVYSIDEHWLRTGEGEMFIQRSRDDELSAFVNELLSEETQDFRRRLVTALSRLRPEQWDALESIALSLMDEPTPPTKLYIAARDGSRIETEVDGDITLPEDDTQLP